MDIQEKKLKLIEEFLRISDEQVLDKMIDEAKLDYQHGRVTTHEDLKKEVLTWK